MNPHRRVPVTVQTSTGYEDKVHVLDGPLYHGGRPNRGGQITTGRRPNSWGDEGPKSTHNYLTTDLETARHYAEGVGEKGRVYEVEPTGPMKKDYASADYKTEHPLDITREVPRSEWQRRTASAGLTFEHHDLGEGGHHRLLGITPDDKPVGMIEYRQHPDGGVTYREPRARQPEHAQALVNELQRRHPEAQPHQDAPEPVEAPHQGPWFHGTSVPNVRKILPANVHRRGVAFPHDTSRDHAYASANPDDAWSYAEKSWSSNFHGRPRVYEVHPMADDVEPDPREDEHGRIRGGVHDGDHRSKTGWRVVRELKMPKRMGNPKGWDQ